jgi:hypothetical protein
MSQCQSIELFNFIIRKNDTTFVFSFTCHFEFVLFLNQNWDKTDEMREVETDRGILELTVSSDGISLLFGTVSHSSFSLNIKLGMAESCRHSSSQSVNISFSKGVI